MNLPQTLRLAAALLCIGPAASAEDINPDRLWKSMRISPPGHDCDFKEFGEGRDKLCYYYTEAGRLRVIFLRQVSWGLPHGLPPEAAVELVADPVGYWSKVLMAKERKAALCCDDGQVPDGRETRHDFSLMKLPEIPAGTDLCLRFTYEWAFEKQPETELTHGMRCLIIGSGARTAIEVKASLTEPRPSSRKPTTGFRSEAEQVLATFRLR